MCSEMQARRQQKSIWQCVLLLDILMAMFSSQRRDLNGRDALGQEMGNV